jgi:hypothetical protein
VQHDVSGLIFNIFRKEIGNDRSSKDYLPSNWISETNAALYVKGKGIISPVNAMKGQRDIFVWLASPAREVKFNYKDMSIMFTRRTHNYQRVVMLALACKMLLLLLNISIHSYTLHCGKQFCPYLTASCQWISSPSTSSDTNKRDTACCLYLLQTSSGAVIFTPCSLGTNGLELNHTRSMSPSDLELQQDQVSAVLPITQRKYFNTALTFWISFVYIKEFKI